MIKGIVVKTTSLRDDCNFEHMAISLFPTPYPLDKYNLAKDLQKDLGIMIGNMIRAPEALIYEPLDYFYKTDPFL